MVRQTASSSRLEERHDLAPVFQDKKMIFAASTGGHLAQLKRYADHFGASPDSLWITFDSPQSRALLADERRVHYTDYIAPREWRKTLSLAKEVVRLTEAESFDGAISTGAAMAVGVLGAAHRSKVPTYYIESVSRLLGPSLTGRIVSRFGLAKTFTQHASWSSRKWPVHRSMLASFRTVGTAKTLDRAPRLFVTLGTIRPYRFDAAIDAILSSGSAGHSTIWQTGVTTREELPGEVFTEMGSHEFETAARNADVVITHAGVGTILQLLEWGIHPVVIPRKRSRNEHVDNHQLQIADLLRSESLATVVHPDELTSDALRQASAKEVRNGV